MSESTSTASSSSSVPAPAPPTPKSKSNFAVLKLYVNSENTELIELYKEHINKHDNTLRTDPYPNSGFDIFVPQNTVFEQQFETKFINMDIKAEMVYYDSLSNTIESCAYTIFPRSSISKTPLMLANHTGIIDSGYRGWLIGAFRSFFPSYTVEKHTRLLQICHPTLCPVYVKLISESELTNTTRDAGGFGSTGLVGV
jgi:dUTP pyrophosphatase